MFHLKTNDQSILKFDPGVYTTSCWALSFLAATSLEIPLYINIKLNFPNSEMVLVNCCA